GGQLVVVELPAVDPHPQHEVAVVQLLRLERGRLPAADPGLALGVQAEPAEPAAQVSRVDRVETALGVDVDDALPHVQPIVVLLVLLVLVQRLAVAERPLAFAAGRAAAAAGPRRRLPRDRWGRAGDRHERGPFGSGTSCGTGGMNGVRAARSPGAGHGSRTAQPAVRKAG